MGGPKAGDDLPFDDDFEWDDPDLQALPAHVDGIEETSPLDDLLLDLTLATTRLRLLMAEVDEVEFKPYEMRYGAFLAAVGALPKTVRAHTPMGFKPPVRRRKKK